MMINNNWMRLPVLSSPIDWGPVTAEFRLEEPADESLISNVSIVPCVGDGYAMMRTYSGRLELPGGTLEPGEHYLQALRREVKEELGAELIDYNVFGYFACLSSAGSPFRPHIPHPNFIRIVGYGEVNLTGTPTNPPDGEQVELVDVVSSDEAVSRFESTGRSDLAELYKLAHVIRSIHIR